MNYINLVPLLPLFGLILVFCAGHVWWQRRQYKTAEIPNDRVTIALMTQDERSVRREWMGR